VSSPSTTPPNAKAAKRLCRQSCKPDDLPSHAEIRERIQTFARVHEGRPRRHRPPCGPCSLPALRLMRLLRAVQAAAFIGSVMTGHVRTKVPTSTFTYSPTGVTLITQILEGEGYQFDVERKQVVKHGEARVLYARSPSTTASRLS